MATGPQAFYCLWQKDQEDISNVRRASSACCNLVTRRLFLRTHLTFTAHTFTRQSRIEALSRIGHHIEHLTFSFPHSDATFLPPLIHPESGREISFLYKPHTSMASVLERPKFANSGLGEILTQQYPPLFHAASNVPSFINAMKHLPNMRHLTVKTPGQDPRERYRRDIVDYALISLRISLERAPMKKLHKISLSSVHPSAFIYLRHAIGFGCLPSAARRWKQIRKLNITVESWDFYGSSPGLDHLKMIDDYIRDFSANLEKLTFTWLGQKGPCPLSLAADPLFAPPRSSMKLFNEVTSPMSPLPPAPLRKPIVFQKLRYMAVRNATMNAPQVASLVAAHQHSVREFDFENVVLINAGSWDEALAPLLNRTPRGNRWTRHSTATIDEEESIHFEEQTVDVGEDLSEDSPAVSAASQELELDLNSDEGQEDELEPREESVCTDLPSDVEAARIASISFPNKLKKRRITKRRRVKKHRHEHREEDEEHRQERHHRRQLSEDSIDRPSDESRHHRRPWHQKTKHRAEDSSEPYHSGHSRRPSNRSLNRPQSPPQLPVSPQSSRNRLFGEVDSVCSTSSRRLFGEVSRLSHSGSEPELTHSPVDESDYSPADEYFRPGTPTSAISTVTASRSMDISAPILSAAPSMPVLLEPTVYDPTAELCSEISAVQRDIEAEEAQRLVAEDAEAQTSALRRAKELVLSRLGREFSSLGSSGGSNGYAAPHPLVARKNSSGGGGGGGFLSSARFREGLFGRSTPVLRGDLDLQRYLHARKGRPAWALVTGAAGPGGRAMCVALAARGFNVVVQGIGTDDSNEDVRALDALRRRFPWNKYRVIRPGGEDAVARVVKVMQIDNLTVIINNNSSDVTTTTATEKKARRRDSAEAVFAAQLAAALVPLLRRNAPALVVNIEPVAAAKGLDSDGGTHDEQKEETRGPLH
ncbi:hypothetical protein GGR52DRAFT_579260 [Hypoxylon sp. FL1284]|nr:hypothetical protein GGR52DRAFT_579260 [Hypoxylon sp. FL1284]